MSVLKTLWAWVAAGIARRAAGIKWMLGESELAEGRGHGDPVLTQGQETQRELAQDQDHCDPPARRPGSAAQSKSTETLRAVAGALGAKVAEE